MPAVTSPMTLRCRRSPSCTQALGHRLFEQRVLWAAEHAQLKRRNGHQVNGVRLGPGNQAPRGLGSLGRSDGGINII